MVRFLKHKDINKESWDNCINHATNRIVYACSSYLDTVSPGWCALIYEDYRFVMPLPVKKQFGFSQIIQPLLTQQLGIFSGEPVTNKIIASFVDGLNNYKYVYLAFNNTITDIEDKNIVLGENPNYVLDLSKSYCELERNFSKNTIRNIRKAKEFGLKAEVINIDTFLSFYLHYEKGGMPAIIKKTILQIDKKTKGALEFHGVFSNEGNLIAVNAFLSGYSRYINLAPASSPEGFRQSAMFLLLATFIEKHAGSNVILDFEGSRIEGVARFYKGFGSNYCPYYSLSKGKMPYILKIFWKIMGKITS